MDREQILKLAKEHCDKFDNVYEEYTFGTGDILAFANAIAEIAAAHEREENANVAYRVCAETRHVTLGNQVSAAIRSRGNK